MALRHNVVIWPFSVHRWPVLHQSIGQVDENQHAIEKYTSSYWKQRQEKKSLGDMGGGGG